MNLAIDHEQLLDSLAIGILVFNDEFKIAYANQTGIKWLGLNYNNKSQTLISDPDWNIVDKHGDILELEQFPAVRASKSDTPILNYEVGVYNEKEKSYNWFLSNAYKEINKENGRKQFVVTFTNISDQKEHIPYKKIVELANDPVIVTNATDVHGAGTTIVYVNKRFTELTGYTESEVIGQSSSMLRGEQTNPAVLDRILEHLIKDQPVREEIINYKKNGESMWLDVNIVPLKNDKGIVTHFAAIERDITDIKDKTSNLEKMAKTDALTELWNRRGLFDDGEKIIESLCHNKKSFIFAVMDIDFFKEVNDNYGHDIGDLVLKHIADLLKANLRDRDIIARFGGEEFVILIEGKPITKLLEKIEQLRLLIKNTLFELQPDVQLNLTCSFGVSVVQNKTSTLEELLKSADLALYKSKRSGRNKVTVSKIDSLSEENK